MAIVLDLPLTTSKINGFDMVDISYAYLKEGGDIQYLIKCGKVGSMKDIFASLGAEKIKKYDNDPPYLKLTMMFRNNLVSVRESKKCAYFTLFSRYTLRKSAIPRALWVLIEKDSVDFLQLKILNIHESSALNPFPNYNDLALWLSYYMFHEKDCSKIEEVARKLFLEISKDEIVSITTYEWLYFMAVILSKCPEIVVDLKLADELPEWIKIR